MQRNVPVFRNYKLQYSREGSHQSGMQLILNGSRKNTCPHTCLYMYICMYVCMYAFMMGRYRDDTGRKEKRKWKGMIEY